MNYNVAACYDCVSVFGMCPDDMTTDEVDELLKRVDDMWGLDSYMAVIGTSDDAWFSNQPCEVCGSPMAGERSSATMMSRK